MKSTPGGLLWAYLNSKKERQALDRGWSTDEIEVVLDHPAEIAQTIWRETGQAATVYYQSDGHYLIRNNFTNEIFQLSNRNDPNWIDDVSGEPIRARP